MADRARRTNDERGAPQRSAQRALPSALSPRYNVGTVLRRRTSTFVVPLAILALFALGLEWEGRVARLRRALESPDPGARIDALRSLAREPSDEARGALLAALEDPDPEVRLEAARALGEARATEAVPALVAWLSEPEPEVRATAARALGAMGDPSALPSLVRGLGDARAEVRRATIDALAQLGRAPGAADAVMVPLLARLDDTDTEVRVAAVDALVAIGDARAVVPLITRARDDAPEVRAAVATALGDLGDARAVPPLVQALEDPSEAVQLAATAALARIGDDDAAQALAVRAASSEERAAAAAAAALGRIPSASALGALIDVLSHTGIAPIAIEALRQRAARDGDAVPRALAESLDAAEARPRADALTTALTQLAGETSIAIAAPALARALDESRGDPPLVLAALGTTGDEHALVPILERLRASDDEVRLAAIDALGRWVDVAGPDGRAADPLLDALEHAAPAERAPLARLLGRVGAPRALPALHRVLQEAPEDDPGVRLAVVDAIGEIGDPEGAVPLVPLLDSRDAHVRAAAARALGEAAGPEVIAQLVARVGDRAATDRHALLLAIGAGTRRLAGRNAISSALAASTRERLLALASSPDRALASAALAAIAAAGDATLAPALVELARRAPPARRPAIHGALASLDHDAARGATLTAAQGEGDAALVALSRLGEHGDRAAAEWLLASAAAMPWPRSAAATFALARLARRGIVVRSDAPRLCELRASRDPWLRANLAIAMATVSGDPCEGGPDPLAWMEPRHAAIVRAAAARWAFAAAEHGAIAPDEVRAALTRCAREPISSPARRACREPALPATGDRADVVAWSADGRELLPRTLLALRLPDGSVMLTRSDDNGRIQLHDVPRGPLALDRPASLPLEP